MKKYFGGSSQLTHLRRLEEERRKQSQAAYLPQQQTPRKHTAQLDISNDNAKKAYNRIHNYNQSWGSSAKKLLPISLFGEPHNIRANRATIRQYKKQQRQKAVEQSNANTLRRLNSNARQKTLFEEQQSEEQKRKVEEEIRERGKLEAKKRKEQAAIRKDKQRLYRRTNSLLQDMRHKRKQLEQKEIEANHKRLDELMRGYGG